jgi:hypothetical protein
MMPKVYYRVHKNPSLDRNLDYFHSSPRLHILIQIKYDTCLLSTSTSSMGPHVLTVLRAKFRTHFSFPLSGLILLYLIGLTVLDADHSGRAV